MFNRGAALQLNLPDIFGGQMEISDLSRVILKLRKLKLHSDVFYLDHGAKMKVIQVKLGKCVLEM